MVKFGDQQELIKSVGTGGRAEFSLVHEEELAGRPVAIMIMHRPVPPNAGDVARFENAMRFAGQMDHPNIITVYRTGTWKGAPFTVTGYIWGDMGRRVRALPARRGRPPRPPRPPPSGWSC